MSKKRITIEQSRYQEFALAICSNTTLIDIVQNFNVTKHYVNRYIYYANELAIKGYSEALAEKVLNRHSLSRDIAKAIDELIINGKYKRPLIAIKTRIKDAETFAKDICNNENNEDIAEIYNINIRTVEGYKRYIKAALNSDASKIEDKIYKSLNKAIINYIKELIQNNKYSKDFKYNREGYKPKQIGPNKHSYTMQNANIEPMQQPELKLPEHINKHANTKDVVDLLSNMLEVVKDLLKKL